MKKLTAIIGEIEIMASNSQGWGIGKTIADAQKAVRKATRKSADKFWIVPKGTKIAGLFVEYPDDSKFSMFEL